MERRYKFWLETDLGDRIVWRSLTERQALEMYRRTRAAHPDNVRMFGWCPHGEHAGLHPTTYREQRAD